LLECSVTFIIIDSSQTPIGKDYAMNLMPKSRSYNMNTNPMDRTNVYPMSEPNGHRQQLTKAEYSPINSSRKLNLLLQRSLRYSYRQRCCGCCPTILCELLFPLILIAILALTRYGTNALVRELNENPNSVPINSDRQQCSQNMNATATLSNDLFTKCFRFPPSYTGRHFGPIIPQPLSNKTNFVFQPMTDEIKILVEHAEKRLKELGCNNTKVW
jgi:hypothetical protein